MLIRFHANNTLVTKTLPDIGGSRSGLLNDAYLSSWFGELLGEDLRYLGRQGLHHPLFALLAGMDNDIPVIATLVGM